MTNSIDQELYKLCKEVYEATNWGEDYQDWIRNGKLLHVVDDEAKVIDWKPYLVMGELHGSWLVPLYTSDYLLEKLPDASVGKFLDEWLAEAIRDSKGSEYGETAYTPLKALLKLTLRLKEEGVI